MRERLARPSARAKPITHAAASEMTVTSMARSAPVRYGLERSASQKMWVSKLASTRGRGLPHVGHRKLMLQREPLQRSVLLQLRDRRAQRLPELRVRLAVVDPERVALREEIRDHELPRMLLLLERGRGVLRHDRVGAADEQLRDGVRVAGIALQVHLRPALGLEPLVQGLEVLLVLRPGLHGDGLSGQ